MPHPADTLFLLLTLAAGLVSGVLEIIAARTKLRIPTATLAVLFLVAVMFAIQLATPNALPLLERNESIVSRLQLWRAVTALFAQDGAIPGAAFNMTILLVIGVTAEQCLGARRWLLIYLGGGIATEFLALAWQPHGSGNSIAVFGLAGALAARGLRTRSTIQAMVCLVAAISGIALLAARDIHGIGFWAGAVLMTALAVRDGLKKNASRET